MRVAGVLRVDHIMALARLYWIPHGMSLHEGTYVSYPMDEMLAVLTLESHRHQCEIIGENLGTVPTEVNTALERHGIRGLYLALYQATDGNSSESPRGNDVAMIGSHDTPTFAGWLAGEDIEDRVRHGLLAPEGAATEIKTRSSAVAGLSQLLGVGEGSEPQELLLRLLGWLGASDAAAVIPWIEDFWLERVGVNLPGTAASVRANWQRPMRFTLDEMMAQPFVLTCLDALNSARGRSQGAGVGRSA
jgi:4-alpha-glucanotransferase